MSDQKSSRPVGVTIPVAYAPLQGTKRYAQIEAYFSFTPLRIEQRDLVDRGTPLPKSFAKLFGADKRTARYLVPYQREEILPYDASRGVKYGIDLINGTPTTATLREKMGFLTVVDSALAPALSLTDHPNFYLGLDQDGLALWLRAEKTYQRVPAQPFAPTSWHEFAHHVITPDSTPVPEKFSDIRWKDILSSDPREA